MHDEDVFATHRTLRRDIARGQQRLGSASTEPKLRLRAQQSAGHVQHMPQEHTKLRTALTTCTVP